MNYRGILRRKDEKTIQWLITDESGKILDGGEGNLGADMDELTDAYAKMKACFLRHGDGSMDLEIDLRSDEERKARAR